jgi:hypothetical protein
MSIGKQRPRPWDGQAERCHGRPSLHTVAPKALGACVVCSFSIFVSHTPSFLSAAKNFEICCAVLCFVSPFPWGKVMIGTGIGWMLGGKIHAQRKEKKLNAKHKEEQKALYTQYYNDVYTLQQQNADLAQALEQMGVRVQ